MWNGFIFGEGKKSLKKFSYTVPPGGRRYLVTLNFINYTLKENASFYYHLERKNRIFT